MEVKPLKNFIAKLRGLYKAIDAVAEGKWDFFSIAVDYVYCKLRFKMRRQEYFVYGFYDFRNRYRKKFLLKRHKKKYLRIQTKFFTLSKYTFYRRIPDLYQRQILLAPHCGQERFLSFVKNHKKIFIKPDTGCSGNGVKLFEYTNDEAALAEFAQYSKDDPMICEELICQHDTLARLHPHCVNSVRILTLLLDGEVQVLSATLKIGTDPDSVIDNTNARGIFADVDIPTGIVSSFGMDARCNRIVHHPLSGIQIIGLQIPNWDIAIDLVTQAHKRLPQCCFFGWDVAITPEGADIIEANASPADQGTQAASRTPKGGKIIPLLKKDRLKQKNPKFVPNYDEADA